MYVSKKAYWNEKRVKGLLSVSNEAVEQALLTVWHNQTSSEQASDSTTAENGIGFSGVNAYFGSSLAKQVNDGRTLSVKQLQYGRKIALQHWTQFAIALEEERVAKGLDFTAPAPKPAQAKAPVSQGDRFTWQPGDLHKVGTIKAEHIVSLDELFYDDDALAAYDLAAGKVAR